MHFSFIAYFVQSNFVERRGGTTGYGESLRSTLCVSVVQLYLWGTPPTPGLMSKLGNVHHVAGGCDLLIDVTVEQRTETEIAM